MIEQSLFQEKDGGLIPTSPLQLFFERCPITLAVKLNSLWHSRVPKIENAFNCFAYCAKFKKDYYAVALWSAPIARHFNNLFYLELRRMAISDFAPKFTASRMLAWMTRDIIKTKPEILKLISYQDCAVHKGIIYKACGWSAACYRDRGKEKGWTSRTGRMAQTPTGERLNSSKIRWEKKIRIDAVTSVLSLLNASKKMDGQINI